MGNDRGGTTPGDIPGAVERRGFLRKAAVVGTGAFAVPMILTVDPADAQALTSPPPEPPRSSEPESPGIDHMRPPTARTPGVNDRRPVGRRASGRTELPRTGANLDRLAAAGLAATAGGAALVLWSAEGRSKFTAPSSTEPEPET
jgi:hypothetical protein